MNKQTGRETNAAAAGIIKDSAGAIAAGAEGIIIKGVGGLYTVATADSESVTCPARGKFRHDGECPYPGDRVALAQEKGAWAIDAILARSNRLIRPAVANVTHHVAVIPSCCPKPDTVTADKLIAAAEDKDIVPVIVINKRDLDPAESARLAGVYRRAGFDVFEMSAASGEGVDALAAYLAVESEKGQADATAAESADAQDSTSQRRVPLVVFSGASGAGKSTLMTRLFPSLSLKTGDVSRKSERGRHTTRTAELFDVGGYFVADTPGFTMLDFASYNFIPTENLAFSFREFLPYVGKCRYTKCTHTKEEGCAILAAVASGEIPRERHENYAIIREQMLRTPEWRRRRFAQ